MFGRKKGPDEPFSHTEDCKILAADPGMKIEWSEIRRGVWEAICVCGKQYHHDPTVEDRVRLDPFDPKTGRHGGACEFAGDPDAAMLRAVLRVVDKGEYDWVECNACDYAWQVPHYAESVR
jgi:hypothetical protein